jgi:hypothetical protein
MNSTAITTLYRKLRDWVQATEQHERSRELVGAMLARQVAQVRRPSSLAEVEFRVHSQFGDDGILQWLVARLPLLPKRFIEFGVEDYTEANTRFLMVNNGWRGLVMDGSRANMTRLQRRPWFWRHELEARPCFVTRENVDGEIARWAHGEPVGLLHIDVDGNDYWLWEAVRSIEPGVVVMEYNAVFGNVRTITIPYRADFRRLVAHHSGQYFGASLAALTRLAHAKGYALIGSNSAGNNAYFVRRELLDDNVREMSVAEAYARPAFRESRDVAGRLDCLDLAGRQAAIRGLPVVDIVTGHTEPF